jgi:hypothetical protein
METALQTAIKKTENSIAEFKARQNTVSHQNRIQVEFIEFKIQALEDNLLMLQSLLAKEREQIATSYNQGHFDGNSMAQVMHKEVKTYRSAQEYYEANFNQ